MTIRDTAVTAVAVTSNNNSNSSSSSMIGSGGGGERTNSVLSRARNMEQTMVTGVPSSPGEKK